MRRSLDPELTFSDARCSKLLPESHMAYLTSLPSHYTTRIHNNQVQQALLVYRQHARGPSVEKYEKELKNMCIEDWKNGRQLCEIRSLTDRHCVHKVCLKILWVRYLTIIYKVAPTTWRAW